MTAAGTANAAPHPLPEPDPYLLFWDELIQMPRVLWSTWFDTAVDTLVGLFPMRGMGSEERR